MSTEVDYVRAILPDPPAPTLEDRDKVMAVVLTELGRRKVASESPSRQRQPGPWTHRVMVVAVAAVILAVFFVPLPHVSLFRRLVTPAKPSTSTSVPIIVPNRATPCTTTVHGVTQGPHGLIELPVDPGRIISRSRATEVAAGYGNGSTAKLTSWTEVSRSDRSRTRSAPSGEMTTACNERRSPATVA